MVKGFGGLEDVAELGLHLVHDGEELRGRGGRAAAWSWPAGRAGGPGSGRGRAGGGTAGASSPTGMGAPGARGGVRIIARGPGRGRGRRRAHPLLPSGYPGGMSEVRELMEACAEAARRGGEVLRERWGTAPHHRQEGRHRSGHRRRPGQRGGGARVPRASASPAPRCWRRSRAPRAPAGAGCASSSTRSTGPPTTPTACPHFAVNVAAMDGAGVAAGATCDPLRDELFLARRGGGATLQRRRALRVSGCASSARRSW